MNGGPVGTVLGTGSTSLQLTDRERQVADLVALGWSYKKIGSHLGLTKFSVGAVVAQIGKRIPGTGGDPKMKVSAWIWVYGNSR